MHAPEWTDHNDSDPGIALIQLFASLSEQIGFRLEQIPEKNHIELLKLMGVRLRSAVSARTLLNYMLAHPDRAEAAAVTAGARVGVKGAGDVHFETTRDLNLVPAQIATLVTTRAPVLTQVTTPEDGQPIVADQAETYLQERFRIAWDGRNPKLEDMPSSPLALFAHPDEQTHRHLWIGLAFNPSPSAGFLRQRVTCHLQLDYDEQPSAEAVAACGQPTFSLDDLFDPDNPLVRYEYYRPASPSETAGSWRPLVPIADETDGWTRSGRIRFDVPARMGPIPPAELLDVVSGADAVEHPLLDALSLRVANTPSRLPISGWLHVEFLQQVSRVAVRSLSFNVVEATQGDTVVADVVGTGNGRPGQTAQLAKGNVLQDSLRLAIYDRSNDLMRDWREVESFDPFGPDDEVFELDREAGLVRFGDGIRGRIPDADARIVARRYRSGGGRAGNVGIGLVSQPIGVPGSVSKVVNIVAAEGGRDAESLAQAKGRAPAMMKSRDRAVTRGDFEYLALDTPGVEVARAIVVPLRRPYPEGSEQAPGLDLETPAAGVVSVVVVPKVEGPHPTPTQGNLRSVCDKLQRHRLLTTEVFAVSPQYVRLFDITVGVTAKPGFTRTRLREDIGRRLETYFHVLRGGPEGEGFGFGVTVHHADIVAQVFLEEGVERVDSLTAFFDSNPPAGTESALEGWRLARRTPLRLTNCVEEEIDREQIQLAADETLFVETVSLNVVVI